MRVAARRGPLIVVAALAVVMSACGGGRSSQTGTVTGTAGGGLGNVPVFGQMHPLGPEQQSNGVTTRSYSAAGLSPKVAIQEYARVLEGSTWKRVRDVHPSGATAWQGAWERDGNTLVVSAVNAPTLSQGSENTSQVSLLLYPKGTTPSTS